jgi:hypothetical protein
VRRFLIAAVLGAVGLVGCGGAGSSDGGVSAPAAAAPTVTITATNQGSVTRAMIDGGQAFGQSQPFATTGGATAQSIGASRIALSAGSLQSVVQRGLMAAFGPRHSASIASATRPAATSSSTDACSVSGSITTGISDADNNLSLSSGDTLTLTFNQCQDSSTDSVSGVMVFTIGSVTSGQAGDVQFNGSLTFVQLNASSGTRLADIQGSVGVTASITSTSFRIALTVGANALTVTSSAPGYLDTIVYEPGMQLTVAATDGAVTQSDVTLDGSFTASSIGGRIAVTTVVPLHLLGTDTDPSRGQVVVTGASGTHVRVTALSAISVQLELDADGDGSYERSGVLAWNAIG